MSFSLYAAVPLMALILDTAAGDPHSSYHPVALIGRLISFFERLYYSETDNPHILLAGGVALVFSVLFVTGAAVHVVLSAFHYPYALYIAVCTIILYFTICPRALFRDSWYIYQRLREGNLPEARKRLSWIVGRDTNNLPESEIARAVIETVAENTTDGIISPLFYFLFFGPMGAALYRAINTMDSMVGYKNARYLYFGRAAARLDDAANFIPARITCMLFVISAFILGKDWKNAWRIAERDARRHPSPNGGWAEAPMAGALGIRLGGMNRYEGKEEFRAYMGDNKKPITRCEIRDSLMMMYAAVIIFVLFEVIIRL